MSLNGSSPLQNLYELRPCLASYTENYVDAGWGMYAGVRQGLAELSLFEDIVQSGSVASGDVGICKHQTIQSSESTSSDILDVRGQGAPRRWTSGVRSRPRSRPCTTSARSRGP